MVANATLEVYITRPITSANIELYFIVRTWKPDYLAKVLGQSENRLPPNRRRVSLKRLSYPTSSEQLTHGLSIWLK